MAKKWYEGDERDCLVREERDRNRTLFPGGPGVVKAFHPTRISLGGCDYLLQKDTRICLPQFLVPPTRDQEPRYRDIGVVDGAFRLVRYELDTTAKILRAENESARVFAECRVPKEREFPDGLLWAWLRRFQPRLFRADRASRFQTARMDDNDVRFYSTHQPILERGQKWDGLYFVLDGCATVLYEADSGEKRRLAVLRRGDFFGDDEAPLAAWMGIEIGNVPRRSFGVTVTAGQLKIEGDEGCFVLHLGADRLTDISNSDPQFGRRAYAYWRERNLAWRVQDSANLEPLRLISIAAGHFMLEAARRKNTEPTGDGPVELLLRNHDLQVGFTGEEPDPAAWARLVGMLIRAGVRVDLPAELEKELLSDDSSATALRTLGKNVRKEMRAEVSSQDLGVLAQAALGIRNDITRLKRLEK